MAPGPSRRAVRDELIADAHDREDAGARLRRNLPRSPRSCLNRGRPPDMTAERRCPDRVSSSPRRPASGDIALVALLLCVASGFVVAAFFDPRTPYRSISGWLLAEPWAALARNVHFWSAQVVLLAGIRYGWRRLRASPRPRAGAAWALALALVAGLLLSGYLLRGDGDARELQRPLALLVGGSWLPEDAWRATAVYALHLAAAVALLAMAVTALVRGGPPRAALTGVVMVVVGGASLLLSPGLHDGLDPTVRVPWFFGAVQYAIDGGVPPRVIAAVMVGIVLTVATLPWWSPETGAQVRRLLAGLALAGLLMGAGGALLQVGDGGPRIVSPVAGGDLRLGWVLLRPVSSTPAPVVLGRAEGCLLCHRGIEGLGDAHAPASIGCASCHGGDPFAGEAARAHRGVVLVPGNLADASRTCGNSGCHPATVPRVQQSIMTTMAGVISANRRVLGEPFDPAAPPPRAAELGHSTADSHLRELCVGCHLGQPKREWGPITEESRGGGCNACHLVYERSAVAGLDRYRAEAPGARQVPTVHPRLTVNPGNEHCFGCHSRSSRISTNYEGWNELHGEPPPGLPRERIRHLLDGRFFERAVPDVHHERGLECIDCHVSGELMGTGAVVARKSDQVIIGCEDCHAAKLASVGAEALDLESRRLLAARSLIVPPSTRIGTTRGGAPLVNVTVDADGRGTLRRKRSGEPLTLKPPTAVCTEGGGHRRLACASCHTAWAPRCTSCHTEYDPQGEGFDHLTQTWGRGTWNETAGPFEAAPPTLGVRVPAGVGPERGVVDTFVPGMIMTFDRNRDPQRPPDVLFRRLYGLTFAHTVRRDVRPCASCHADPVALGFGAGVLRYETSGAGGRWHFTPRQPPSKHDGLPEDAWTGFLQARDGMVSARDDVRPLSVEEQKRILRVGACLSCHRADSPPMRRAVSAFDDVLARRSSRCVLPAWPP